MKYNLFTLNVFSAVDGSIIPKYMPKFSVPLQSIPTKSSSSLCGQRSFSLSEYTLQVSVALSPSVRGGVSTVGFFWVRAKQNLAKFDHFDHSFFKHFNSDYAVM